MQLIEHIKEKIRDNYVLVDDIDDLIAELESRADEYADIDDPQRMCHILTDMLRDITHDVHFSVNYVPPSAENIAQPRFDFSASRKRNNNYFYEARRLTGNIGYLDFRLFPDTAVAAETAIGAIAFLGNTDALIFDLRKNRGGTASMIQLILSYFFEDQTLLNTFYERSNEEYVQSWTLAYVPGKRMVDVPIYVLISGGTGSAAEEFAYDVQQLKRGTLVGQTTVGAGHTVAMLGLEDGFSIHVPSGKPINPVSGTNWQGVGVQPDIETPIEEALYVAHMHALETLIERTTDDEKLRAFYEWEWGIVKAEHDLQPVGDLSSYVGQYGDRKIVLQGENLVYHSPFGTHRMLGLAEHTFAIGDDVRATFEDDSMTLEWRDMPRKMTFEKSVAQEATV